jgi:1,2-diacylglycerol 3-alpha-glucosyltransferase
MGCCDVLEGCGGTLLAQSSVADFTAQVLRLLRDPELRQLLSERARGDVLHWSIERTTAKLVAYYASLVEENVSASGPLAGAAVALDKVLGTDVSEQ